MHPVTILFIYFESVHSVHKKCWTKLGSFLINRKFVCFLWNILQANLWSTEAKLLTGTLLLLVVRSELKEVDTGINWTAIILFRYHFPPFFFFLKTWHTPLKHRFSGSQAAPSCFSCSFKSYMTSGQCYEGNIFLIALPFSFILCRKSGMAIRGAQYKNNIVSAAKLFSS